jgi:hypothetical protein
MLGAVAELAAAVNQVFEHDEPFSAPVRIPVRVIAFRRRHLHAFGEVVIEARLDGTDVHVVEGARPVRLQAQMLRQASGARGVIPLYRHAQLRGVAVEQLHNLHLFSHRARIPVLQRAREPLGRHLVA